MADSRKPEDLDALDPPDFPDKLPAPPAPEPSDDLVFPERLPIIPLAGEVCFPGVVGTLVIARESSILLIDDVQKATDRFVVVATQRHPITDGEPMTNDLYTPACICRVLRALKFPDGATRVVVQGLRRCDLVEITRKSPYPMGKVTPLTDVDDGDADEQQAAMQAARNLINQLIESGGRVSEDLQVAIMNQSDPSAFADVIGNGLQQFAIEDRVALLAQTRVSERLTQLCRLLRRQVEMQNLTSRIEEEVSGEIGRRQREDLLRQKLAAIQRELGDAHEEMGEVGEFIDRLDRSDMPEEARREARRELDRMGQMHPSTPEYHVIRTFVEALLSMPWAESTEDSLDLKQAKVILDEDHYDLTKVKDRIIEHLAVRKLKPDTKGPILCFVGPPGVGKTSLGKSIARTMGRKFLRISLGGVHDESEIRGHRRTYIGSMPGRIIQGIRRLGVNNPVFMLDEIDKLGRDYRGDPAAALLEVLDPEQNSTFRDHYLDVEFDLSRVLFICTANTTSTIPAPLLDRMEVIRLSGYSEYEKFQIAQKFLVPKQREEAGLHPYDLVFRPDAIQTLINEYTRESGLRNLEREIASVCRKVARRRAEGNRKRTLVDAKKVVQLLGPPPAHRDRVAEPGVPGVVNGLVYTSAGGEVATIEVVAVPGKPNLKLTGMLGDVMKESAATALSYLQANADRLGIDRKFFEQFEIHIHVPDGATPKDGPSAGITLCTAMLSMITGRPVQPNLAMTGEITLTGRVLIVGGIREKLLAAHREGIRTIVLPADNEKDLADLPAEIRDDLTMVFVRHMDEVVPDYLSNSVPKPGRRRRTKIIRAKGHAKQPPTQAP